ncbi:NAD(P)-binding domain-containing protein [Pseudomaricurvus alkylphenolicus]|uniref:flavin-containing monooxygenase n=1 Tax=Pseudomaricurvus alkylphenolicus TaxID=1306991 RepID=UPI00141E9FC4|nr:NAD(P)/FAD-dependent oxidoreductase [Pseudomaricurvus alkylphenolicus]NIB42390.1 NAD(P)-binding domain-containing protein [Pseudomaricurvus alkylphenolicus]
MNSRPSSGGTRTVATVVIGAGQAGLTCSYYLRLLGVDHVVLERGDVGSSWRHQRWDSMHLLTPNGLNTLPGMDGPGSDPNGFMHKDVFARKLLDYSMSIKAPVLTQTEVLQVSAMSRNGGQRFRIDTRQGTWLCRSLIIASGAFNQPRVPVFAKTLPDSIQQVSALEYRNPARLAEGPVLVVGASATGLQLANEIRDSGREVSLAVGEHVRLPRRYRGRDIFEWMDRYGILSRTLEEADDINRVRNLPSPQLIGGVQDLDLNVLTDKGIQLHGRLMGCQQGKLQFSGSLNNVCELADLKMRRLLKIIDEGIDSANLDAPPSAPIAATQVPARPELLKSASEFRTLVWATGFKPDYSWLQLPVLDAKGRLKHREGVVDWPGVYVMGLPYMRQHKSSFICGVAQDARAVVAHLVGEMSEPVSRSAAGIRCLSLTL